MNWAHDLLQANIYLVVFYGFYKYLLDKETYFTTNRIYLVTAGILSFVLPALSMEGLFFGVGSSSSYANAGLVARLLDGVTINEEQADVWTAGSMLAMVYLLGVIVFTLRFLLQLFQVRRLLNINAAGTAFSFFNKTVIDPQLQGFKTIQHHEEVHSKQLHSLDVLLFEILAILTWFNPVIYFYKHSLKSIHEYLADEQAAKFIGDKEQYALLLVSSAFNIPLSSLTNSFFNQSLLKKRIFMLQQPKSTKKGFIKYGLFLPVFIIAIVVLSSTLRSNAKLHKVAAEISLDKHINGFDQAHPPKKASKTAQTKVYDFVSVERTPTFPGGMDEFYHYLKNSLKYPAAAKANNVQGKVFLSFIVETDGSLKDIKVLRKLGSGTDEEAVRVLKESPKWVPGMLEGRPVRVLYNIPINFALPSKNPVVDSVKNQ
jgi:TonB family protein